MGNDVNITSSGKRVDGKRTSDQEKRLKDIKDKKAADAQEAAHVAAEKQAAEERRIAEEKAAQEAAEAEAKAAAQREAVEKIGSAALSIGSAVATSAAKGVEEGKLKVTPKTAFIVVAALAIVALLLFIAWPRLSAVLFPAPAPVTHVATELSESAVMGNTTAEISAAVLGEARQKQELVVWEQDVQVESAITSALANLAVFSKTKTVRSFGTGVYTVDMGKIDEDAIAVDENARTVTMTIPHARLQYITKDLEKTEFEDTQHALLGFGDVKLTQEQQNLLEQSIEDAMRAELESDTCFADADEAALLVVYDVYQPLVNKIDDSYTLEIAM